MIFRENYIRNNYNRDPWKCNKLLIKVVLVFTKNIYLAFNYISLMKIKLYLSVNIYFSIVQILKQRFVH